MPSNEEESIESVENSRTVWVLTLTLMAPMFAISTHMGFILVAWLTDMSQASSVILIYLAALLYLFFMLRQCYSAHSKIKPKRCCWSCLLPLYPFWQCLFYVCAFAYTFCCCKQIYRHVKWDDNDEQVHWCKRFWCYYCKKVDNHEELDKKLKKRAEDEEIDEEFNTKAFCIVFSWMWVLGMTIGVAAAAFILLPIKTIGIFSDLLKTFQILILLVSLLITYKILSLCESDINRFLKKVRNVYLALTEKQTEPDPEKQIKSKSDVDNVEAAACLVAELAEVVMHKLKREDPHALRVPGSRNASPTHFNIHQHVAAAEVHPDPSTKLGLDQNETS